MTINLIVGVIILFEVFISAGLNDILQGATRDTLVERFMNLKEVIDRQNAYHPQIKNEDGLNNDNEPKYKDDLKWEEE